MLTSHIGCSRYPDKVLGFDMVGEEDKGNSHLFYIAPLTELYDPETELSKVPLYMHTAETNWAEDLVSTHVTRLSVWRQKGLTGYCFKYIDRPFCLRADDLMISC